MSFVRLYTAAATFYQYEDIWDVDIDPQRVSGANYLIQEGRTATFTMAYDTIYEQYIDNPNKPDIYRAMLEIWESYTMVDADHEPYTYERRVFVGYLAQDSFKVNLHGVYTSQNVQMKARTITVRAFDYLFLLAKYPPQSHVTLMANTTYNIENLIQSMWELQTYNADPSSIVPLWARPSLDYQVEDVLGFGLNYDDIYVVESENPENHGFNPEGSYVRRRVFEENGAVYFEYMTVAVNAYLTWALELRYAYWTWHRIYRLVGTTAILETDEDWLYAVDAADYPSLPIVDAVDQSVFETHYDIDTADWGDYQLYTIPDTQNTYEITYRTTSQGSEIVTLYASGLIMPTQIVTMPGDDVSVPFAELLQLLLNIQVAFIHSDFGGNSWVVSNKAYFSPITPIVVTDQSKLVQYDEEYDNNFDKLTTEYAWLQDGQEYVDAINSYLRNFNLGRYNRVCTFATNQLLNIGRPYRIPLYNSHPIFITSVDYDIAEPQLYKYEGRSL